MTELHVDGNGAGGLLQEVFPFEMTMVRTVCGSCGAGDRLGALAVYDRAPGTVVRCASCEEVRVRVAHDGGRYGLDLRGVRCLEIDVPG
jgi:hypothetical protein